MHTEIIHITDLTGSSAEISLAAAVIRAGGLVVFPTETVYGLGGNGLDAEASRKIYAAKGRPSNNPLIIHIHDPAEADKYAYTGNLYNRLAAAFMPGPLTVILPKRECIPYATTGGLDTVAVRCPDHPIAHALLKECGDVPVAAPSANLSGKPSPTVAEHVIADLSGRVDIIIDGGESDIGLESTIVSIGHDHEGEYLTLLRPGAVTADALTCVCERVVIAPAVLEQMKEGERPLSPGMMYKHYAPATPLVLLDGAPEDVLAFLQREQAERSCAILCYLEEMPFLKNENLFPVGGKDDLATQAHCLFSLLREADKAEASVMYAHLPDKSGLGLALYNRMIRAAAHTIRRV
ncbi:MAG: threonylcarbamoyl-AMP synthase [Clostridia bacterium]|nr:threonylcarbamoyl-AMP synthase [Clostridia bacterium]